MTDSPAVRPGYGPLWWLLGGSALLSVIIVGWHVFQSAQRAAAQQGDGKDPKTYGFELAGITSGELRASGLPRDGLIVLDEPATITAKDNDALPDHKKIVVSSDRVIGIVGPDGGARAYPLRLMTWHAVVNDRVGGRNVAVVYDPLCDAAVAFERGEGETAREFGYSGLVLNGQFLMYDRAGESLWSPLLGQAVSGRDRGRFLSPVFLELTTWGDWRGRNPETTVLSPIRSHRKRYKRATYGLYRGVEALPFPVTPFPPPEPRSPWDRMIVVVSGEGRLDAFALSEIAEKAGEDGDYRFEGEGRKVHFVHDPASGTVRVNRPGEGVAVMYGFWFAVHAARSYR